MKAGYRLVCREDVFVYHRGSASFGKNPKTTVKLLKKNKLLLEKTFGIKYSPQHPRERQLYLVESYIKRLGGDTNSSDLHYKIENRMRMLNNLMPRGFIKHFGFMQRLKTVRKQLHALNG